MDKYVSRDDVRRFIADAFSENRFATNYDYAILVDEIDELPAADVQSIRHGRWEEIEEYGGWGDTYFRCSICGDEWDLDAGTPVENGMKYCPNCGARMDGDK